MPPLFNAVNKTHNQGGGVTTGHVGGGAIVRGRGVLAALLPKTLQCLLL